MTVEQLSLFAILAAALGLFIWGRWRHDVVALAALIAAVAAGLVPGEAAFEGFGHPAVITVACVLVLSRGLQTSGVVEVLTRRVLPPGAPPLVMLGGLTALTALVSGVMNNVGALALVMPVALQAAAKAGWPPGRMLMPLAFGSILGGMTTLIGTPPNLIVSAFRDDEMGGAFRMFDFTPVGLAVAAAGVAFITLIGWRLVPARERAGVEGFEAGAYLTEARVPEGAKAVGMTLAAIEETLEEADAQILGIVRREVRLRAPRPSIRVRAGDILMLEAEPGGLASTLAALDIKLEGDVAPEAGKTDASRERGDANPDKSVKGRARAAATAVTKLRDGKADTREGRSEESRGEDAEVRLMELVVLPGSSLIGRSARAINLRTRYGINLLALSRHGKRSIGRLRSALLAAGDVLLVQGSADTIGAFAADHGCVPLAERALHLPDRTLMLRAVGILLAAIAAASTGIVPTAVAFAGGVLAAVVTRTVPPRTVYTAIDWSVIVLLGALLPVAGAMQTTGAASLIAGLMVGEVARGVAVIALVLVMVLTMTLSDIMNNAATVAVMAPIALGVAGALEANPDAFLMAVAVGGSCAFLTPIGHQNNTLILGPGGFRFGDYWRLGLPLEALVIAVAVPMILLVWGL